MPSRSNLYKICKQSDSRSMNIVTIFKLHSIWRKRTDANYYHLEISLLLNTFFILHFQNLLSSIRAAGLNWI